MTRVTRVAVCVKALIIALPSAPGFAAARLLGVGGSGKGSCARRLPAFSPPVCIQANPKLYGHGALPGRLRGLNPLIEAYDYAE